MADPAGAALALCFVAGPDVDALDLPRAEILAAVEGAVRAQGEGQVVLEPRVPLAPPNGGAGHFIVLRGTSAPGCATADLDVPAGRLCVVRGGMADFQVVATAAGLGPAEDRGIT